MIRPRCALLLLVFAAVGAPALASAQSPAAKEARIGFLYGGSMDALEMRAAAFLEGVREADMRRVTLVSRAADGDPTRLPALAGELVAERLNVLFATGPAAVRAAHTAAPQLAVVALDLESDPVASGFVESVARPGGHLTGVFLTFPISVASGSSFSASCYRARNTSA
jgi:putative ABC transport system substrate-binding protein